MTSKISKVLLPSIIGILVYVILNKLFPEKEVEPFEKDPLRQFRGGSKRELIKAISKKIFNDRALKIALCSIFATAGVKYFESEIEALLINDVFKYVCFKDVADENLKVVCDIIQEHDLNSHTDSIKSLIVSNNLSENQKLSLLKIKLDYIINGECAGKKRFLIVVILGIILSITISGVGGLALILEALYQLFKEGKIGKALYKQLLKNLARKWGAENVPIENFVD